MNKIELEKKLLELKKTLIIIGIGAGLTSCAAAPYVQKAMNHQNVQPEYEEDIIELNGKVRTNSKGEEEVYYSVPSGYSLTKDKDGNYIAVRRRRVK